MPLLDNVQIWMAAAGDRFPRQLGRRPFRLAVAVTTIASPAATLAAFNGINPNGTYVEALGVDGIPRTAGPDVITGLGGDDVLCVVTASTDYSVVRATTAYSGTPETCEGSFGVP
ncbi:MAG TPA: hypothetical protein VM121_07410 [Acidimicrobiales bacterium]|nr:hypothetical protein [Acidimicrobiales bacterium]